MGFNIHDIVASISKNFFAKPNRYEVRIMGAGGEFANPDIMINCANVNVPGMNIGFGMNKPYGIGLNRPVPQSKSFTELTLTFYETEYERERLFFSNWMNEIYNEKTNRFGFYNNYVKNVTIIQYDTKGNITYECDCIDAFPSNVSPLDKAYGATDTIPTFNVNLQFHKIVERYKVPGSEV